MMQLLEMYKRNEIIILMKKYFIILCQRKLRPLGRSSSTGRSLKCGETYPGDKF